jgi:hypothetical protein
MSDSQSAATRTVYRKRTYPHTVHELHCQKLDQMFTKGLKVKPENYEKVPISDVSARTRRCRICVPGVA